MIVFVALMMEALSISETSVSFNRSTLCDISQDKHFTCLCDNLKSYFAFLDLPVCNGPSSDRLMLSSIEQKFEHLSTYCKQPTASVVEWIQVDRCTVQRLAYVNTGMNTVAVRQAFVA